MNVRATLGLFVVVGVLSAACFRTPGAPVRSSVAPPVTLRSAEVTAADVVIVVLTEDVGSDTDAPGDVFDARLGAAVVGEKGELVAERWAPVRGVVCIARSGRDAALALDITHVETVHGPREVRGRLVGASRVSPPNRGEVYDPDVAPFDAFFSAWHMPGPLAVVGPPAGVVYPESAPDVRSDATRIELPVGTRLNVHLDQPLASAPVYDAAKPSCVR